LQLASKTGGYNITNTYLQLIAGWAKFLEKIG